MLLGQRDEIRGRVPRQRGFREVFIRGNEIVRLAVNVGEIAASPAGDENLLPDSISMLEHGDTPPAIAGLDGAEESRGPAAKNQGVEFAHQERISLDSEAAVCRVFIAMTLKVKLGTGEDRENCLRSSARKDCRRGTASHRSSRTFRLPSRKGIASA